MKFKSCLPKLATLSVAAMLTGSVAFAQGYYDDDIYYDASKAKKEVKNTTKKKSSAAPREVYQTAPANGQATYYYDGSEYVPWDNVGVYQAADTYQVNGTSTRDVDEYNRHTSAQSVSSARVDSITLGQFEAMSNTRNLARFQNSDVAKVAYAETTGSDYNDSYNYDYYTGDGSTTNYYGSSKPTTTLNINVIGGYPYYNSWYWNRWGWDPYWGYAWGPSWSYPYWSYSWGWGGPSWSWGWGGPSWSWGWGWHRPGWGYYPGWGPGPDWGHHWGYRPHYSSPGAYAPNSTSGRRTGYSGRNTTGGTTYRYGNGVNRNYGNSGNGSYRPSGTVSTSRPGYQPPTSNPNQQNLNGTRGRGRTGSSYNSGNSGSYRQQSTGNNSSYRHQSSGNSGSYRSPSSGNSYNSGSSSSPSRGRSSSGSFSTGGSRGGYSSGSFGGGGGRSSGGGGGHRGR